jgi:hypothetical protein
MITVLHNCAAKKKASAAVRAAPLLQRAPLHVSVHHGAKASRAGDSWTVLFVCMVKATGRTTTRCAPSKSAPCKPAHKISHAPAKAIGSSRSRSQAAQNSSRVARKRPVAAPAL